MIREMFTGAIGVTFSSPRELEVRGHLGLTRPPDDYMLPQSAFRECYDIVLLSSTIVSVLS